MLDCRALLSRAFRVLPVLALLMATGLPPYPLEAAPAFQDAEAIAGTYSFLSPDPFAAGNDMVNLRLTLGDNGLAHLEQVSAARHEDLFSADGTWTATADEVRLVMDQQGGAPMDEAHRYTIHFTDGFPTEITAAQSEDLESFGPLAFTLGSGDDSPLLPRLNQLLARVDHVDFRDPGPNVRRFGEPTRKAVTQFQSTHGLVPTGLVDLRTWQALQTASSKDPQTAPGDGNDTTGEAMYSAASAPSTSDSNHPIYLTFDDGPNPSWTPEIMDVLARYGAKATFFMVGQEADQYPDLVRQVVKDNHYVADHTWAHESLEGVSQEEFVQSVESTRQVLVNTASDLFTLDGDVAYVRPPYGATDESTREYAADLGMDVVMWDLDPMDWREPGAQQIATYVLDNAYPGAIVLLHDGGGDRSQTVSALNTILPELAARGYRFPTIFEGDPNAHLAPSTSSAPPTSTGSTSTSSTPANPNAWHVAGTGGAGANVREAPSTTATVVAVLADGTEVQPIDGPVEGDGLHWLEVAASASVHGWVATDLLQTPARGATYFRPLATTSIDAQWVVGGTDGAGANLRALPSTQAEVVAVLQEGTPVQLLEGPVSADGMWWRKVRADGSDGWIVASCVRLA